MIAEVLAGHRQWAVVEADVMDGLARLPAESVHCVVTSVPYYGLRDYGTATWVGGDPGCDHTRVGRRETRPRSGLEGGLKTVNHAQEPQFKDACGRCGAVRVDKQIGLEDTLDAYLERMVAVFREVRRTLRKDGTLWLNVGDSYTTNMFSHNSLRTVGQPMGDWSKEGQRLPKEERTKRGTVQSMGGLKPKDLMGVPWRLAFALQADGWWLRSDVVWSKPNPMPESVEDRPTRSHEYVFLLTKSARYAYDAEAIKEDSIHAGEVVALGAKSLSRGQVTGANVAASGNGKADSVVVTPFRNKRTVWHIATEPFPGSHFAVFPTKLVEPCVLAGCPSKVCPACGAPWRRDTQREPVAMRPNSSSIRGDSPSSRAMAGRDTVGGQQRGSMAVRVDTLGWSPGCAHGLDPVGGVVLDPFLGSGTSVLVALRHGRRGIGIELNPGYCRLARDRIVMDAPMFNDVWPEAGG